MRAAATSHTIAVSILAALLALPAHSRAQEVPLTVQQLTIDASSPEVRVRRRALRALRDRGGPETLPVLARLVADPQLDIREGAIEAVIGIYVHPPAKRSMSNAHEAFLLAPYRATPYPAPPELQSALVTALADDYPSVRRDAAYALGIVMTPPVSSSIGFELTASLSDRVPDVRVAAALVLGRLRVLSAGIPLIGRVNDEELDVRLAAMRAIGDLRDERAVPALTDQFEFYRRGVAGRAAIDALGRIASPSSRALFELQTDSGYPAHRQAAYEGLARIGGLEPVAPRIEATMSLEGDERVRTAMLYALTRAGRPRIELLFLALADRDTADQALEYLVELGSAHTAEIAARLRDPNPVVREQIAIVLGFIGGQEAAAALNAAASDESADVETAVSVAQLRIRQRSGRPPSGGPPGDRSSAR
jgi:HEAT repeat protein